MFVDHDRRPLLILSYLSNIRHLLGISNFQNEDQIYSRTRERSGIAAVQENRYFDPLTMCEKNDLLVAVPILSDIMYPIQVVASSLLVFERHCCAWQYNSSPLYMFRPLYPFCCCSVLAQFWLSHVLFVRHCEMLIFNWQVDVNYPSTSLWRTQVNNGHTSPFITSFQIRLEEYAFPIRL